MRRKTCAIASWGFVLALLSHGWALDGKPWPVELVDDANPYVPALERAPGGDEVARFELLARLLWSMYRYHDDRVLLQQCYSELRVAALSYRHRDESLVRSGASREIYGSGVAGDLVATCALYGALRLAGRIAGVLTHLGDYELIEGLAEEVRQAFRRRFLTVDGHLVADCQSVYVAALHHNLLEPQEQSIAQQRLAELLAEANYHTDVCPAIVHALLPTLTQAGRLDLAYMVLLQTSAP